MITWLILVGAVLGGGIALLISELRPAPPELSSALDRLHRPPAAVSTAAAGEAQDRFLDRLGGRLVGLSWARIPYRELALVGRSPARFMAYKLVYTLVGLVAAPYLAFLSSFAGLHGGVVLPAFGSLVAAGCCWFIPDVLVRGEAAEARTEYLHGICAYLELVALERASDSGPSEALIRAAQIGHGTVFRRIALALDRAALDRRAPWDGLDGLAEELGITALQDVADIMRISGTDGASVYQTLRARARNLRAELLADELAKANVDSERMVVPGSMLVVILTGLIAFPAVYQMFHGR